MSDLVVPRSDCKTCGGKGVIHLPQNNPVRKELGLPFEKQCECVRVYSESYCDCSCGSKYDELLELLKDANGRELVGLAKCQQLKAERDMALRKIEDLEEQVADLRRSLAAENRGM